MLQPNSSSRSDGTSAVTQAANTTGGSPVVCPVCQTSCPHTAKFCMQCSTPLAEPAEVIGAPLPLASQALTAHALPPAPAGPPQPMSPTVGTALPPPALHADPTGNQRLCPNGHPLDAVHRFCPQCGSPIPSAPQFLVTCHSTGMPACSFDWSQPVLSIGKAPDCDLVMADDAYVSRHHAVLRQEDGQIVVEDSGSSNGTFIRVRRPFVLQPGDEIVVGCSILQLSRKS